MLGGRLEGPLGEAEGLGADVGAAGVEEGHGLEEAHADLADHVIGRDARIVEEELRGMRVGEVPLQLAATELVGGHDEGRDAAGSTLLRIGHGKDDREVGVLTVGDVVLVAVDDPLVPVTHSRRADGLGIAARLGLSEREAHRLLGSGHGKHIRLPQMRWQLEQERRRAGRVGRRDGGHGQAHARARGILDEQGRAEHGQALSAGLLRHVGGVEPLLRTAPADVTDDRREGLAVGRLLPELAAVLVLERPDLPVEEGAEGLAERRELVGDAEVHRGILPQPAPGCSR